MSERTHCYIGVWPACGCVRVMVADDPQYKADTAKDVADMIKRGYDVRHVTWDEMHALMAVDTCKPAECPNPHNRVKQKALI